MRRLLTVSLALAVVTTTQADMLWSVYLYKSIPHPQMSGTGTADGNVGADSGGMNAGQLSSVTSSQYQPVNQQGSASINYEMGLGVFWYDAAPSTLYVCRIESGTTTAKASTLGSGSSQVTVGVVADGSAGNASAHSVAGGQNYSETHGDSKIVKTNLKYTGCLWDVYADLGNGHKVYKLRGYLGFNTNSASASGSAYIGGYYPNPPWYRTATSISTGSLGVTHHVAVFPLPGAPITDMGPPTPFP